MQSGSRILDDYQFSQLLDGLQNAFTIQELKAAMEETLALYGLKHVVYHAVRLPQASISQMALVHTYPDEWISHYASRRYYLIDPVVIGAQRGIIPIDWKDLDKSPQRVNRLFGEAEDVGIGRQGLTIPIRGTHGERALFTVTSDCSDAEWERLRIGYLRDMQVLAIFAHNRVLDIKELSVPAEVMVLSRRERECLLWAAAGKTVVDTSAILSISPSAVKCYLDSSRTKLNCLNKVQTVARALALGIISI